MMSVGLVSTVKTSRGQLLQFVYYHLNLGMDRIFLYFDDPADSALSCFSDQSRVTCIRCDSAHWAGVKEENRQQVIQRQAINATRALQMARELNLDWLLRIDSDELLYCPYGLHRVLSAAPPEQDWIRFHSLEAVPRTLMPTDSFRSRFFRVLPRPRHRWQKRFRLAQGLGCGKYFLEGRYFRGHQVGKAAVRTSADPYRINPHKPLFYGEKRKPFLKHNARVLHFESNDFESWHRKMFRWLPQDWQKNPRAVTLTSQLKRVAEIVDRGGPDQEQQLKELYKQFYFIGPFGRLVLQGLGLLRRIHLDPSLFESPADASCMNGGECR